MNVCMSVVRMDTCLYDNYDNKQHKSLQAFIKREMMLCTYDAVIIGSFGTDQRNALKVMIDMGMPKTKATILVKWCSTSNIINSLQI